MAPRHDEFSFLRRAWSVLCLATAAGLLVWNVVRIGSSPHVLQWWLPFAVLAGMIAADFVSGVVHWAADTWGSETMPIIGRRLLHPFRVHHVKPDDFLRRQFIDTNGDVGMLMAVPFAASLWIPLDATANCVLAIFVTAFCGVGLFTNQVHQWAHMPAPPAVVRALQDWGIILGRQAHQRHHDHPYDTNYCIATGWCNRPLAAIDFFRRLERLMSCVTGVQPRADDRRFKGMFTH